MTTDARIAFPTDAQMNPNEHAESALDTPTDVERPPTSGPGAWMRRLRLHRRPGNIALVVLNRVLLAAGKSPPFAGRKVRLASDALGHPVVVRIATTDFIVYDELFVQGEYDSALAANLGQVRTILDLGSNIGLSLCLWRKRFPDSTIIGVEPDRDNISLARENISLARPGRTHLIMACATANRRQVHLDRSGGPWAFRISDTSESNELLDGLPVLDILARCGVDGPIDVLKCDIEGAEEELFAECSTWINRVQTLIVETHGDYSQARLEEDLCRNGFVPKTRLLKESGTNRVFLIQRSLEPASGNVRASDAAAERSVAPTHS